MGLIAAEFERRGIVTVCVQPVRHVAERVRPPRSVLVPWGLGYPLGRPNDAAVQHRVIEAMLTLAESAGPTPMLAGLDERPPADSTRMSPVGRFRPMPMVPRESVGMHTPRR